MSIFTFIADLRGLRVEARRIADALDRAYPPPTTEPIAPSGEADVSYASDEATSRQILLEEATRLGFRFDGEGNLIEGPEQAEEEDVQPESH